MVAISGTIVGLPRSRTYWFSKLLTYNEYHCFHCYPHYDEDVPSGKMLFNSTCIPFSGIGGDLIIVERDFRESVDSFINFIQTPISVKEVENLYQHTYRELERLKSLPHMLIKYEDVDSRIYEILGRLGVDMPDSRVLEFINTNYQSPDNGAEVKD